jgi:hypothetical protein
VKNIVKMNVFVQMDLSFEAHVLHILTVVPFARFVRAEVSTMVMLRSMGSSSEEVRHVFVMLKVHKNRVSELRRSLAAIGIGDMNVINVSTYWKR